MKKMLLKVALVTASSLISSSLGALISAGLIHFWPNSTARFEASLWLSIFCISFIGVFAIGLIIVALYQPLIDSISSAFKLFLLAGFSGSFIYLLINVIIALMTKEIAIFFFKNYAFVIPIVVGFIFGSLFGGSYHLIRHRAFPL